MESLTKQVLKIIKNFIEQENISMSEFARKANISKSWLSRLQYENSNLSIETANRLLNTAGYEIVIKNVRNTTSRLKKNNMVIVCQNIQ